MANVTSDHEVQLHLTHTVTIHHEVCVHPLCAHPVGKARNFDPSQGMSVTLEKFS
jgi:hypothetical protein